MALDKMRVAEETKGKRIKKDKWSAFWDEFRTANLK